MSVLVERSSEVSPGAIRGVAVTALVAGLFSPLCHADDITYGYDALSRLTSVTVAGAAAYYDYDAAGNITAIRRQAAVASAINDMAADAASHFGAETASEPVASAQAATR